MSLEIRPITMDEMGMLGLDDENQLYWGDEPIEIKKRISFTIWQKVGAVITILSALSLAMFDALRFFQGR